MQPAPPRDAATVVLVRDAACDLAAGTSRLEVFLLRRVSTMAFAAGMYVFPGGKVDPADDAGPGLPQAWADALTYGDATLLRRVVGAAVRETAEEAGVSLQCTDLRPFAHWLTPEVEPRRYDTRFLLAALPAGAAAQRSDGEAEEGIWLPPVAALELPMLPPTHAVLRELAGFPDVATALGTERVVRRIAPRLLPDGEGWRLELEP